MIDVKKIYVGSWFQRTTLHLSEIYDFMKGNGSPLALDEKKLSKLRKNLRLKTIEDLHGSFECINATTTNGITLKIYEDGLMLIGKNPQGNTEDDIKELTSYYEDVLSKGISYIFSLGAPIPKELSNIKTVYPYFVVLENATSSEIDEFLEKFKQTKHFEIKKDSFEIHRGETLYIINVKDGDLDTVEQFIEEQVFIREFKGQMHRYLNLHRIIWENIAEVKERGKIKGKDIRVFKEKIESYQKTINMIDTRIRQMGTYINTRSAVIKNNPQLKKFEDVLQFKHETLNNTLSYIEDLWSMTKTYVESALSVFSELQAKATNNSIKNLTVVTSMGVGGTLLGLFAKSSLPSFTLTGLSYFLILAAIGWAVNTIMNKIYLNKDYSIKNIKVDKNIK